MIILAPNAFKNSLPADIVAQALQDGIMQSSYKGNVHCCPVGDGGDGTGEILKQYFDAEIVKCKTVDAIQRPADADLGLIDNGKSAIIELADASGLRLLKPEEYNPLIANTRGTDMLIKAALDKGVSKIILCIGGSATVDGGSGILKELGAKFLNASGAEIKNLPLGLVELEQIDLSNIDKRLQKTEIIILCDVKNKLLGTYGAATMFGPQKGATDTDIIQLEKCLTRLDEAAYKTTGKSMSTMAHSGAAGGVAAALCAFCNATAVDGISYFLELIHFEKQIANAGLIITGEGAIDSQTLEGKAPLGVALTAKKLNIPVIAVAGKIAEDENLKKYFDQLICINAPNTPLNKALRDTYKNLVTTAKRIGNEIN